MKALSIKIAAGIITLGALFYFLACSPATQNNNSGQNQTLSPNQNKANTNISSKDLPACDDYGSDPVPHAQHIKKGIEDKMGPSLKRLLKSPSNPGGTFTIEVQRANNAKYFVAYIKGKVSGDDNLKDLSDILNDFQSKQECLRVIYLLPEGASLTAGGFEWIACEHPMVVCPNGECCLPVDANTSPLPTQTPNTNTNANANANTGGNRNN